MAMPETGKGAVDNAPVHGPDGHTWHHPDGQLRELILGTLDYPGKTMPSFAEKLTDGEIDAVLEYIKSNWESEQRELQEEVSRNWLELNDSKRSQMSTQVFRLPFGYVLGMAGLVLFSTTVVFLLACGSSPDAGSPAAEEQPVATTVVVRSGQEIFASVCSSCHGLQGQGQADWHIPKEDGTLPAPPLNGDGHTWHHGDGLLYRIVREGGKMQEDPVLLPNFKSAMPAFGAQLSHEEIVAVLTYNQRLVGGQDQPRSKHCGGPGQQEHGRSISRWLKGV